MQLPLQGDVLDLGCGWGSISVIIKKQFPACTVTGTDVNPRAVELAQLNAERNETGCRFLVSDGFDELTDQSFDWIISNPPIRVGKEKLYNLFAQSQEHLRKNGCLLIVIRRKQGAESAVKELNQLFGNCAILERDAGYWILSSKKLTD